jgi:hypothetical protein
VRREYLSICLRPINGHGSQGSKSTSPICLERLRSGTGSLRIARLSGASLAAHSRSKMKWIFALQVRKDHEYRKVLDQIGKNEFLGTPLRSPCTFLCRRFTRTCARSRCGLWAVPIHSFEHASGVGYHLSENIEHLLSFRVHSLSLPCQSPRR